MVINYEKPMIEFEEFELDAAIATGCGTVVSLGPGDDDHAICSEYIQDLSLFSDHLPPQYANFYEGSCSCYLSAGVGTLFTS